MLKLNQTIENDCAIQETENNIDCYDAISIIFSSTSSSFSVNPISSAGWGSSQQISSKNFELCPSYYCKDSTVAEKSMFRAVIMQALLDSVNNSKRTEDKIAKREALAWFNIESKDFTDVCHFAGWNPFWVINEAKQAIERGCKRYGELELIQKPAIF